MNVSRVLLSSRRPLTSVRPLASVSSDYDAVIIGGGHNGLVAAAYLAKSGLKTCVLERRHVVGGAAVTEEIIPGYKFSRASYVLSLLRPQIFDDLELKRHGLKVHLRSPSSYTPINKKYLRPGGPTSLILGASSSEDHRQIAQFSERDARKYAEFEDQLNRFVDAIDPLLDHNPINTKVIAEANVFQKVAMLVQMPHLVKAGRVLSTEIREFYELMTAPASKILDKWFESEPLKATLATDSCIGAMISPDSPGSGYVLLHHVMGGLEGIRGAWGYPQGGMGAVSDAIANSAVESGATIRTSTPVREIVMESGSAKGVVLEDGSVVASKIVLSNATPRVTFQREEDGSNEGGIDVQY